MSMQVSGLEISRASPEGTLFMTQPKLSRLPQTDFSNELPVFQVWERIGSDIVCTRKLGGAIHSYSRRAA